MNVSKVDLNLLVYLDVLLKEQNVTRAAERLGITQPAMSNGLRRLRKLFNDPILVRTSEGMTPTVKANELKPVISDILLKLETTIAPNEDFDPMTSSRTFRVMASDYAESTVLFDLLDYLTEHAPNLSLDIMTPSDVTYHDVELGKVDMAINRFEALPMSFHQKIIWSDDFSCVVNSNNPVLENFNLNTYLSSQHIWVSKTGYGVGVGIDPNEVQKLGWVDEELSKLGYKRKIKVFTRHYHAAMALAKSQNLIATLPTKATRLYQDDPQVKVVPLPFDVPGFNLKMAWSPLLHHDPGHVWLRSAIGKLAQEEAKLA